MDGITQSDKKLLDELTTSVLATIMNNNGEGKYQTEQAKILLRNYNKAIVTHTHEFNKVVEKQAIVVINI